MVGVVLLVVLMAIFGGLASTASAQGFALAPTESPTERSADIERELQTDVSQIPFTYPVVLEPEVVQYLRRFRGRSKPTIAGWLARMGQYQTLIETELQQADCPPELIAVAMIESGFSPDAYSRAGAVGVWQFMLPTALSLGARVDDWVDERRHVQASTRLAARLLKENYKRFGSWHLALAAYNAGGGTVSRAIKKGGTNDYWRLIRAGLLPREASNYVPKAIASMIAIRRPDLIGLDTVVLTTPPETATVSVSGGTDVLKLAKAIGTKSDRILDLNPHLRRGVTPPDGEDFALVVPRSLKSRVASWVRRQDGKGGEIFETVTMRFGERLKDVAWLRRLSLRRLRIWNDLTSDDRLSPGTPILVPANQAVRSLKDRRLIGRSMPDFAVKGRSLRWFPVLYSQPLGPIAAWFGTTSNNLRLWNGLADADWVPRGAGSAGLGG